MIKERDRLRFYVVLLILVVLHFTVRPWLGNPRGAPDFMLLALMLFAIRARPGSAAVAGLFVGLVADSLADVGFGAGALAHTVLGYLQAWGKTVFFPDNLVVNAGFFFFGTWGRDLMVLLASGQMPFAAVMRQMATWSLLQAVTTTLAGITVLLVFRRWVGLEAAA